MYTDLFNTLQVNKKLIKLVGINPAIYLSEILEFLPQVIKKKTFDAVNGFFPVNRTYIEEQTTLALEEQYACDKALAKAGLAVIDPEDNNKLCLRVETIVALITEDDAKTLKAISKATKVNVRDQAKAKKEGIIAAMKKLAEDPDSELSDLYMQWVESVYGNKHFLTKEAIQIFRSRLKQFANNHRDVEITLLKSAIVSGWKDPEWIINSYTKNHKQILQMQNSQKVSSSIATDTIF